MEKHEVVMKLNVPFAVRQYSFAAKKTLDGRNSEVVHNYILALARELQSNAPEFTDCKVKAIRLGGGCASIMRGSDFDNLLRLIRTSYDLADDVSITMRVNPADINGANMPFYNRNHVTRYDLEIFSLEPDDYIHLDYLNYRDQLPYIIDGFLRARQRPVMGFVLLYGKKTVSKFGFRRTLLETARRPVSHVILQKCGGPDILDDASCARQLEEAREILLEHGYHEYLPCRFALEGCEDTFWKSADEGTDVIAFGLDAVTRLEGTVSTNIGDLELYLRESGDYRQITASVDRGEQGED